MKNTKVKLLELNVKKRLSSDFLGAFKTAFKGSGMIFHDLREYVVGDSIKNIDWKTTAKYNDVYVKNYEEERNLKILFALDISKGIEFGSEEKIKLDLLLEIFFILAFSASKDLDTLGVLLYNGDTYDYIDFKSGEENIFRAVNKINTLLKTNKAKDNLNTNLFKKLESLKIKNSLIFVLSDKTDFDSSAFKVFGQVNEIVFISIYDYFENNLSDKKFSLNLKGAKGFLSIFFGNDEKRKKYITLRKQKIENFKNKLRESYIDYIYMDTKTDVFRELLKFFKSRTGV
ncbi:MAG: DUF58 domain-containing protein [Candidatus Gracilibacteria bacterium]|nr:DUF58 domain-containing protein [Candidatus Gracilibacteria bacterium]